MVTHDHTFANGVTFNSTAMTPDDAHILFQPLVARILGFDTDNDPQNAYSAVRVAWQQEGQPAWTIDEDVCVLECTPLDDAYGHVRDGFSEPNDHASILQHTGYTQVWELHLVLYGPACADHARLITSALSLDWTHDYLAASNVYMVADWHRPVYAPELKQGQWWKRADVKLKFNELVNESMLVPTAAGVPVALIKEDIFEIDFEIGS